MADTKQRFFVSYAGPDRAWAEWVGWQLKRAGHEVELDRWDWRTGDDFVEQMNNALDAADAVVALFSSNYFAPGRWTREEWSSIVAVRGRLVPVAIEPLADDEIPTLLAGMLRSDLHGLDEAAAIVALLEAVHGPTSPSSPVAFPGLPSADTATEPDPLRPRLPSSMSPPEVWNVRRRNPDFSGRETEMAHLRNGLISGQQVVWVLHGMGGTGKSQMALEYAHRFASQYDIVWWVDAEQVDQLPVRYTELAERLGIAKSDAGAEVNSHELRQYLRTRHRWLLILDNAEQPDQIELWLPEGPGHVLITSRNPDWHGIAHQSDLGVFVRTDSLAYFQARVSGITTEQADLLAQDLGDLPLALAQAGGVLRSGMSLDRYRELLTTNTARLLAESDVRDYPAPLAATVNIAVARLTDDGHPDAAALIHLGAFLGPEPIPTAWLERARPRLAIIPGDPGDPMWLRNALQPLGRYGLARIDFDTLHIHRLTQAILRMQVNPDLVPTICDDVAAVLAAASPGDPRSPASWPAWSSLTAHLTTPYVSSTITYRIELRSTLTSAVHFFIRSGQSRAAQDLGAEIHGAWSADLGPDHPDTLTCAQYLGHAIFDSGDYFKGRLIIEDTLDRRRRVLGEDHPDTLHSAHDASTVRGYLGEYVEARRMMEDVLARRRRVLGENDPDTLTSANNLAFILRDLGEYGAARQMAEDVLARRRRVLGEDHPETLTSATGLANTLRSLGDFTASRSISQDVFARRRRVLGADHPDTLASAINLARYLGESGQHAEARRMIEDVLDRHHRVLGRDHPHTLASISSLAVLLLELGEYGAARQMAEDVLARRRRVLGEDHPSTLASANNLATVLHALRLYPEAVELYKKVRLRAARVLGTQHPEFQQVTENLATSLRAMGRTHEAQQLTGRKMSKGRRRFGRKRR
ncbi:FxSxx-COOH system tetratricopeptide repeat protein [Streptomyces albogriseolus]|uniref:FxSxx-COOH system tetratricopeptide repeat protein n=1 Tax=Streptomyces albogriseolus TaxID=1887 RepID=UPI003460692E